MRPEILGDHQVYAKKQIGTDAKHPLYLVFHGGSGSTQEEFNTAIKNGVVKVNLDTDCQYAYLTGIRDYVTNKIEYLKAPVGNPEGADKPNKNTLTQESGLEKVKRPCPRELLKLWIFSTPKDNCKFVV